MKLTLLLATILMLLIAGATPAQQPKAIDGSVNPELISDNRAYSMLFRIIANRTGQERAALRAYLEQIGFTGEDCADCPSGPTRAEAQIDKLFDVAQEFHTRVESLPQTTPALLQDARATLSDDLAASLRSRLGSSDAVRLHLHIQRMKGNMKISVY